MIKNVFKFILISFGSLSAQQNNVTTVRDGFIGIATDARAAGQGDIGVATSVDAFSQLWNPSKYVFSDKKFEVGVTSIRGAKNEFDEFDQLNLNFYNNRDNRSAYGLGFRGYAYTINQFEVYRAPSIQVGSSEISIDGSYTLRLSNTFAMGVGGRFLRLEGKAPHLTGSSDVESLYGIDVSGFYYGNEIAYKEFNGRWRAGVNLSNLRAESLKDTKVIEIYAPSMLRVGVGFDFVFGHDKMLAITTEYKMLLDSYVENASGEMLDFGLEGSVVALGVEYTYKDKLIARTGYSHSKNRLTDSFTSLGIGLKGEYVDVDIAYLFGLSEEENPIREKLRLSLSLNLEEMF